MPNSKYPQQIDTSVEFPPIRDNITEIGSDVINGLRSAIFNIEKTLGINPHGISGNTVASRLSKVIDENGNILKEALDRSNVLSGPIIDADVSRVAGIKEEKLRLDFPTRLLQSEISTLNSQLSQIIQTVESLSTDLSIHLSPSAINSHKAKSISVDSSTISSSDVAALSLQSSNLQAVLQEIYNSHIGYSGLNISENNKSHSANQIYYDNTENSAIINSNSVQGAIDQLVDLKYKDLSETIINLSSNGRVRKGKLYDPYESEEYSSLLLGITSANYSSGSGLSYTTFTLVTPQAAINEIGEFDILTVSSSPFVEDNKDYQVKSVILDGFGSVQNILVYGGPKGTVGSSVTIKVTKNPYSLYNIAGFATTVRPRKDKTNTPDIQFLNPDSATILSSNIQPKLITASNNTFNISIDGNSEVTIDTYDATYSEQTLDTIIQKINDQAVDQHLNFTAFKVRQKNCYEIAIAHNIPNFSGDTKNRTIEINIGSTNDGSSELGFFGSIGIATRGRSNNTVNINGVLLNNFGPLLVLKNSSAEIASGSLSINSYSSTFSSLGVRVGDIVVVDGSTDPLDDGTYRVKSISDNTLTLDLSGATFSGELSDEGSLIFLRATSNVDEFTFSEISGSNGTIVFDTFLTGERDTFSRKRLEIEGSISSGPFSGIVSDVSKGFIIGGENASLSITTAGYATLTDPTGSNGESVYVGAEGKYKIYSSDGLSYIILSVNTIGNPISNIANNIYGFNEVGLNNFHMSRGSFATAMGRILGTSTDPGIPSLVDKRVAGTVDSSVISDTFVERYIEGPRGELRSNGVIRGCDLFAADYFGVDGYQTFSIAGGIAYVNGIRFEYPGVENFVVDTLDPYVVAIDSTGCILAAPYIQNPSDLTLDVSPFFEMSVATLAEVDNDGSAATIVDLRMFVDNLDLKVIGDVKVSNDRRNGHFTSISDAVAYAKRFSKLYPDLGLPSILIEAGEYEVQETILLDFDIKISGVGPNTVIRKSDSLTYGITYDSDKVDMGTAAFMIGGGSDQASDLIVNGVSLSNFTYKSKETMVSGVGCAIALTQLIQRAGTVISPGASYRFENISFQGPDDIDGSAALDADKIGEFALVIGQQDPVTLAPESSLRIGNIIFKNCFLDKMGLEKGCVKFTESAVSFIRNIIVSNNIVYNPSPNLADSGFVVLEYPSVPSITNVIEVGNVRYL